MNTPLISADQFETEIQLIVPTYAPDALLGTIRKWIEKNKKFWPEDLTAEQVLSEIPIRYLPYWAVNGAGSANWYASIGTDRDVLKRCGTCGGSGRYTPIYSTDERRCDNCAGSGKALGKETFWSNQSGHADANLEGILIDNFDEKTLNLQIGKRDFKADWRVADSGETSSIHFIAPLATTKASARKAAEETLIAALERDATADGYRLGDYVRNVKVANVTASHLSSAAFGYPLYFGDYQHKGQKYRLEADGVTGKFWAQRPAEVVNAYDRETTKYALVFTVIFVLVLIGFLGYSTIFR
jgi:hypothetical protein